MKFTETAFPGAYIVELEPRGDDRGFFVRTFCKDEFKQTGHSAEWVQQNQSLTRKKGTIRGLHFQRAPQNEIKLIRCIVGRVYDVIVDLRKDSPTFLKWSAMELSADNNTMLYVPAGFAHGFQTLEDNSALTYLHSDYYNPAADAGIRYNDPLIGIKWPIEVTVLSEKDQHIPYINNEFLEKL